jgi:hypothetical protein
MRLAMIDLQRFEKALRKFYDHLDKDFFLLILIDDGEGKTNQPMEFL